MPNPPSLQEIARFRQEVAACGRLNDKCRYIANLDGVLSLPVLIQILQELSTQQVKLIDDLFQTIFADKKSLLPKPAENIFLRFQHNVEKCIEPYVSEKKSTGKLTPANTKTYIDNAVEAVVAAVKKLAAANNIPFGIDNEPILRAYLQAEYFTTCTLAVLAEANGYQVSKSKKLALMWKHANQLIAPFDAAAHCAAHMTVTRSTEKLVDELATWAQGLHARTYHLIASTSPEQIDAAGHVKKDANQLYPVVQSDEEDKSLHGFFKILSKYDFAVRYLEIGKTLMEKVNVYQQQLQQAIPPTPTTSTASVNAVLSATPVASLAAVPTPAPAPAPTMIAEIDSDDEEDEQVSDAKRLFDKLMRTAKSTDDSKINALLRTLKNCQLTADHKVRLCLLEDNTQLLCSTYINNGYLFNWLDRTHSAEANDILGFIKTEKDPEKILKKLFEVRLGLIPKQSNGIVYAFKFFSKALMGQQIDELLIGINKLLLDSYEELASSSQEYNTAPSMSAAASARY
jgi:hypothetical protein